MGTDESRIKIRALIWGMCVRKNPPSIWLTINPADTQDPIAQVLCGEHIDLDRFDAFDDHPADAAIAGDPYASACFFHLTINAILQCLLGISSSRRGKPVQRETGILGDVEAYIGTVEAQGRGSLHLHMILWLKGSGTSKQMKERLLADEFRAVIQSFISVNIRAHLPDIAGSTILSIPQKSRVAFSRPVDPRLPCYKENSEEAEKLIARTVQVHQCGHSCLKFIKDRSVCKRRAPFPLAPDDWIDEDGRWGPKRTYGFFNNWCPPILQCIHANHDIKLLTNGVETKDIAWYITHYVAKKQNASSNTSALLAKNLAFHHSEKNDPRDLSAINRRLIQRCGNCLSRQQELSAPEIISYLMGWGDRFISHHFETIPWYPLLELLKRAYPVLYKQR